MLLAVDGNNSAWAGFHALRRAMGAETPEQLTRAAFLGLTQSVMGLLVRGGEPPPDQAHPDSVRGNGAKITRLAVAFDHGRPLRRRMAYPAYQTGREATSAFAENEQFVLAAIDQFIEGARCLPLEIIRGENTEADDLVAKLVLDQDGPARIASTDRDFMQLVDGRVSIYSPVKRLVIDETNFVAAAAPRDGDGEPIAFPRERYLDYRVASGDASDDLPGLPGVGATTAARLLGYASLDTFFERPGLVATALGRRSKRVEAAFYSDEGRETVARNRELMDLRHAATHYESLEPYTVRGRWDEASFRAWIRDQRVAGMEVESTCRALDALANAVRP